ncbi:MAG TPA: hypothetical protein ENK80_02375 [Rhodobacterales bacterium]|nr:hypothetical protein [Rhodobacterales bacterium]
MIFALTSYFLIALTTLVALSLMILKIGHSLAACPDSPLSVRPATLTVTTGFVALGAGGVVLIGACIPAMDLPLASELFLGLGIASIALGLGFSHAIATLRAVTTPLPPPAPRMGPWEPRVNADRRDQ